MSGRDSALFSQVQDEINNQNLVRDRRLSSACRGRR